MYELMRSLGPRALVVEQVPLVGVSLVTAELFYKFHSFTLESAAFLATWFALDAAASTLRVRRRNVAADEGMRRPTPRPRG